MVELLDVLLLDQETTPVEEVLVDVMLDSEALEAELVEDEDQDSSAVVLEEVLLDEVVDSLELEVVLSLVRVSLLRDVALGVDQDVLVVELDEVEDIETTAVDDVEDVETELVEVLDSLVVELDDVLAVDSLDFDVEEVEELDDIEISPVVELLVELLDSLMSWTSVTSIRPGISIPNWSGSALMSRIDIADTLPVSVEMS